MAPARSIAPPPPRADDRIDDQLRELLDAWQMLAMTGSEDVDASFMTATFAWILGDESTAWFAIDRAIERGDRDDSAFILQGILQDQLEGPATE